MSRLRLKVAAAIIALAIVAVGLLQMNSSSDQRVIVVPTDDPRLTVSVIFPNQVATSGLAHYTEHLAWLNTVGASERAADRHSNAWTSSYAIGYWLSGTSADLPAMLDTLAGLFDPIDLPQEFAAQERDIVLSEYALRLTGNIDASASERLAAHLYEGSTFAESVIGTPEQILRFDYDAARAFHAQTHRRELATFVVTGDVTARQVYRAMRDMNLPPASPLPRAAFTLAPPAETLFQVPDDKAAARLVFRKIVALDAPIQYDLLEVHTAFLSDILESNVSGGLAGSLRFDAAIARNFDVAVWPLDENHIEIGFWSSPDRGVSLTQLQQTFEATLAQVASAGIPQATYTRILDRFGGFWPDWDDTDDTSGWMADYVMNRVSIVREPLSLPQMKALEAEISLDTTHALLRQLNEKGRVAVAFIGPQESFE